MNTTSDTTYDFEQLTKTHLSRVVAKLGEKGDWARVSKEEIIELIETHPAEAQLEALRAIGATDDDIENMRVGGGESLVSAKDAISAMMAGESGETTPAPAALNPAAAWPAKKTAPAPAAGDADQVAQIAALLAQVLATNKVSINSDDVAKIATGIVTQQVNELGDKIKGGVASVFKQMQDMLDAKLSDMPARKLDVTSKTGTVTLEGRQHKQFDMLLKVLGSADTAGNSNLNVWLTGLPGTGKTRAAANAAEALGMKFYCNGSIANKYELIGFKDAHGNYQSTPFRDAWESGGVYLFDEVDGSVPSAVLAFNSALANGIMAFPDGMLKRHKDCIIIAAANTNGQGATAELVGRMKQDAAFLDRFVFMNWQLDTALEKHIAQNDEWVTYVQQVRKAVETKGVKVMVTPRASLFGAQLLASGMAHADVVTMTLKKGMTETQWDMVKPSDY
ncbi:AAA family ATPase [Collimonas humicola]|uniref:AAA family ATPase n=1 Tax=Collimonas humicola TaxID=2825886 RepID=UPI001B8B89D0|nr:AAA family ATPase [Collimonas humicola]